MQTPGLLPNQWQSGDVPIAYPNSTNPNWPVVDMTKNVDFSWQAPPPAGKQRTLTHESYDSPGHLDPAGKNYLYNVSTSAADRAFSGLSISGT